MISNFSFSVNRINRVWCSILPCLIAVCPAIAAPPNFVEDVQPIFKEHCLSCHNPDKKKAGLDLSSLQTIEVGSSGGEIVKAGVPDTSILYMVMNHHEDFEPMPPKKPKIPDDQLKIVHAWIAGGLLESKDGKSQLREMSFDLSEGSSARPENPAVPEGLLELEASDREGVAPVIALAASPWADVLAASGHERILLYGKEEVELEPAEMAPVAEEDLICRWSFDEASELKTVEGKIGSALLVDKENKEVPDPNLPTDFLMTNPEFTISMWVKPDLDLASGVLFGRGSFTIFLEQKKGGWTVRSQMRNKDNGIGYFGRIGMIEEGKWQHVAVTRDQKEWAFFYNGEEIVRQVIPEGHREHLPNEALFHLGGDGAYPERRYRGGMDEFQIHKRVLSGEEIREMLRMNEPMFTSLGALDYPEGTIHQLRFSPNGELLVAAGGVGAKQGSIVVFDVKTGKRKLEMEEGQDVILSADISPDHSLIVTGSPSKLVKVFSAKDGKMLHRIEKHTDWVSAVRFSPDGKLFASGDRNGGIHVWESATGGIVYTLDEHKVKVTSLSWRSDGKMLASAGEDGKFVLWDMKDGWPVRTAMAHEEKAESRYSRRTGILDAAFHRDGRLMTVGRDRAIRVYGADGSGLSAIESLPTLPLQGAFSVDGNAVFTGGIDGSLRIWSLDSKAEIQSLPERSEKIAAE